MKRFTASEPQCFFYTDLLKKFAIIEGLISHGVFFHKNVYNLVPINFGNMHAEMGFKSL